LALGNKSKNVSLKAINGR